MDREDGPVEPGADRPDPIRVRRDAPVQGDGFPDRGGPGDFRPQSERFGHLRADPGAPLEAVVVPAVRAAVELRIHADGERVRFVNQGGASQEIVLRLEFVFVDAVAQAGEGDAQIHVAGIQRLAAPGGPGAKLRRHAGLEDRQFDGEAAVPEHAAVVGTALVVFGLHRRAGVLGRPAPAGRQHRKQCRGQNEFPAGGFPVK